MEKLNFRASLFATAFLSLVLLFISAPTVKAQLRNFELIYSDNVKGDVTVFGNTLMNRVLPGTQTANLTAMDDPEHASTGNSIYHNGNADMQQVDVDGSVGDGGSTRNSSSADLILPPGTNTIKLARLYWGGRASIDNFNLNLPSNQTIRIRKGTSGPYFEFAAQEFNKSTGFSGTPAEFSIFQGYVDITEYVVANGSGTYTVGNAPLSTGDGGDFGNFGGWCIYVVYENPNLPYNSVRLYDGYQEVYRGGAPLNTTINLSGLDVPSGTLALNDAKLIFSTWEGDAFFKKDYLKVNNTTFSDALNPDSNAFNGTISRNGIAVTTKNPNYSNQMGIDIDEFPIGLGYGILPGATSAQVEFGTIQDQYFAGVLAFVIKMVQPSFTLQKTVRDANGNGDGESNEVLTYKIKASNLVGAGNGLEVVATDTLPDGISFVPGSLRLLHNPGSVTATYTDASGDDQAEYIENGPIRTVRFRMGTGATTTVGGTIPGGDSCVVEFQATINPPVPGVPLAPITNIARLKSKSEANVNYLDEGTAVITPVLENLLPVVITSLEARLSAPGTASVNWATSMEIDSRWFDLERSEDGFAFRTVYTTDAAGNSDRMRYYSASDNLMAVSATVVYYRIRQTGIDGKVSYSKTVSLRLKKGISAITVSPNPFRNFVNINIDNEREEMCTVNLLGVNGKTIASRRYQLLRGTTFIRLGELGNLPAGQYYIRVVTASGSQLKTVTRQ
jgi:fimbrial isopeptide formation D2 family protein